MERLTVKRKDGKFIIANSDYARPSDQIKKLLLAIDRLAAYEDTGLEPEEVMQTKLALIGKVLAEIKEFEGVSLDRMIELAQAEKDGRLVVLPCKVGDQVYVTYGEGYKVCIVSAIHIIANGKAQIYAEHLLTEKLVISDSELGKTVFLTHEEAEEALKKREGADDEKSDSIRL